MCLGRPEGEAGKKFGAGVEREEGNSYHGETQLCSMELESPREWGQQESKTQGHE